MSHSRNRLSVYTSTMHGQASDKWWHSPRHSSVKSGSGQWVVFDKKETYLMTHLQKSMPKSGPCQPALLACTIEGPSPTGAMMVDLPAGLMDFAVDVREAGSPTKVMEVALTT